MKIPINTDERDYITDPRVHDAELEAIHFGGDVVRLVLKEERGRRFELKMEGVVNVAGDGIGLQNVVLEIELIRGRAPGREILEELLPGPHPTADRKYHDAHEASLAAVADEIAAGSLMIVDLIPAVGMSLAALCKQITTRSLEE